MKAQSQTFFSVEAINARRVPPHDQEDESSSLHRQGIGSLSTCVTITHGERISALGDIQTGRRVRCSWTTTVAHDISIHSVTQETSLANSAQTHNKH